MKTKDKKKQASSQGLVPKLRFPEFQDARAWEVTTLGELAIYENGKAHEQDIDERGKYIVTNSKFISTEGGVRKYSNVANLLAKKGDILMVLSDVPNGRAIAKCFCVDKDNTYTVNQRICKLTTKKAESVVLFYILDRNSYFLSFDDGVKQTNLKKDDVLNCPVLLPKDKTEQQKIADCLSSLDELIAAQAQKLDTLKSHKKGLMQQLFPAPGQTTPTIRFPEFRDTGEWKEKQLGDIGDVFMCRRIFAAETNDIAGVPFFKIGTLGGEPDAFISEDLFEEYRSKYNFPKKGEILITCSGTVGKCLPYDGREAYYQDSNIVWIDNPVLEVSNEFLYSLLLKVNWANLNSTTITRIYGSDLRSLSVTYPTDLQEQQKIADCLSSLDELIAAQGHKLDTLKSHKKGLMQQLFPNPDEVNG